MPWGPALRGRVPSTQMGQQQGVGGVLRCEGSGSVGWGLLLDWCVVAIDLSGEPSFPGR